MGTGLDGMKWLLWGRTMCEVEGLTEHGANDNGPVAQEWSEVQA